MPEPEETDTSVIFRIKADVVTEKLIELSLLFENQTGKPMKLDELLVLSEVVNHRQIKLSDLASMPNIGSHRLQAILDKLQALEFIETTGKTSGLSYILHISKRKDTSDKIEYVKSKKQEEARQKEAILRYLDSIEMCILTILTPILMMLTPSKRAGLSKSSLCLLANRQRRSRKDITFSFS